MTLAAGGRTSAACRCSEADDDVDVPDPSCLTHPMLGRPLSECYGGNPLAPAVRSRVACEEALEMAVGRTSEPPQIGLCDLLHRPRIGLALRDHSRAVDCRRQRASLFLRRSGRVRTLLLPTTRNPLASPASRAGEARPASMRRRATRGPDRPRRQPLRRRDLFRPAVLNGLELAASANVRFGSRLRVFGRLGQQRDVVLLDDPSRTR